MIANELIENLRQTLPVFKDASLLNDSIDGSFLSGLMYFSKFSDTEELPLLPSEHVGSKQGTGLVHIGNFDFIYI